MPVPDAFLRRGPWNFLLITVDTVRYDHTGFGGYQAKKGRDTTPELDMWVKRAVSFTFASAPSAGTMASIPAILTSKFFHDGISLDVKVKPGMPPRLKPENTTLPEVMKRGGYRTGAILSHEYFQDWGMNQGVDSFDNALGAKADPFRSSADQVTDKAQAWIARQGGQKWFLWCHYIDPHGRYVAHPGDRQFGASEEDLYDGELAFTDKHLGRLLDALERSPAGRRTVVVLTSDHGDGFGEHGHINHGMALYREMLHVPLIVYAPDLEARAVDGPVSPLDVLPTIADLAGIDVGDLALEGESLVPQLFYHRDARYRTVYSETNWPEPLRAAISDDYKLIVNLKTNVYQLYDLKADPWEKKNVYGRDAKGSAKMKERLDAWLDRVFYSRDAASQAQQNRAKFLLDRPPAPEHPVDAAWAGAIRLLGWDGGAAALKPGGDLAVTVYLRSEAATSAHYKLELQVVGAAGQVLRHEKAPGDGTFPTARWRPGDLVKDTLSVKVPPAWAGTAATVELRLALLDDKRQPAAVTGPDAAPAPAVAARLGTLPLAPAPGPALPPGLVPPALSPRAPALAPAPKP